MFPKAILDKLVLACLDDILRDVPRMAQRLEVPARVSGLWQIEGSWRVGDEGGGWVTVEVFPVGVLPNDDWLEELDDRNLRLGGRRMLSSSDPDIEKRVFRRQLPE